MATLNFGEFVTDPITGESLVVTQLDIHDTNYRVQRARVINNSDFPAKFTIRENGVIVFEVVVLAQQTEQWNITSIQLGWQPDYWNDITQTWNPAGIELGGYTISAAWPWTEA